jgi:hypothetical protein
MLGGVGISPDSAIPRKQLIDHGRSRPSVGLRTLSQKWSAVRPRPLRFILSPTSGAVAPRSNSMGGMRVLVADCRADARAQIFSQCLPAIQSRICVDATVFFGLWGFKVPAITLQPFLIISWANCFASASVLNLRVARAGRRSTSSRLGVMFARWETYQVS